MTSSRVENIKNRTNYVNHEGIGNKSTLIEITCKYST